MNRYCLAQAFAGVSDAVQKKLVQAWRSQAELRKQFHVVEARHRYEDEVAVLKACSLLQPLSEEDKAARKAERDARTQARKRAAIARAAREESAIEQMGTALPQSPLRRSERHSRAAYSSHGATLMTDWR